MQHRASHGIGVIACVALAIMAACRQVEIVAAEVARIDIEPEAVELRPGETHRFTVVLTSAEGERLAGRTIEWASADPAVATIDAEGRVEARGAGETHISARVERAAGSAVVRVQAPPPPPPPPPPASPPKAPSDLKASARGDDRIHLQWKDDSDDETRFIVARKSREKDDWKHVAELPANTTSHMDRGLEEETRYWYRVLACRGSHCAASKEVSERTKDD